MNDKHKLNLCDLDTIRRCIEAEARVSPLSKRSCKLNSISFELKTIYDQNQTVVMQRSGSAKKLRTEIEKFSHAINKARVCLTQEAKNRSKAKRSKRILDFAKKLQRLQNYCYDPLKTDRQLSCFDPTNYFCESCKLKF